MEERGSIFKINFKNSLFESFKYSFKINKNKIIISYPYNGININI